MRANTPLLCLFSLMTFLVRNSIKLWPRFYVYFTHFSVSPWMLQTTLSVTKRSTSPGSWSVCSEERDTRGSVNIVVGNGDCTKISGSLLCMLGVSLCLPCTPTATWWSSTPATFGRRSSSSGATVPVSGLSSSWLVSRKVVTYILFQSGLMIAWHLTCS